VTIWCHHVHINTRAILERSDDELIRVRGLREVMGSNDRDAQGAVERGELSCTGMQMAGN